MIHKRLEQQRGDEGELLVWVLIFVLFFGLVSTAVLTLTQSNLTTTSVTLDQSQLQYGADAGVQWGTSQVEGNGGSCGNLPSINSGPGINVPGLGMTGIQTVSVQCDPISGLGANTFGNGYSVITGDGYNPLSGCVSMVSDGQGGGVTTDATGTTQCPGYKTPNGGSSPWTAIDAPMGVNAGINAVYVLDTSDIWMVGNVASGQETIIYYDGDDGTDITTATNTGGVTNQPLFGVYAQSTDNVWAVGGSANKPIVLHCSAACTSAAATWASETVPSADKGALAGVYGNGATVWAVGAHYDTTPPPPAKGVHMAEVIGSSNGGAWTDQSFQTTKATDLTDVYASDSSHVWVVGAAGAISGSTNGGSTWTSETSGTVKNLTSISGIPGTNNLWAAGAVAPAPGGATVLTSADGGSSWSSMNITSLNQQLNSIQALKFNGTTFLFAVGAGGSLARWGSGSGTWTVDSVPTGTPAGTAFAGVSGSVDPTELVIGVGSNGGGAGTPEIVAFTPSIGTGTTLATISGGKVYNGETATFYSGVQVTNGDFEQYETDCTGGPPSQPKLTVLNGFKYTCSSADDPTTIAATLTENLPNASYVSTYLGAPSNPSVASMPCAWTAGHPEDGCVVTPSPADSNCPKYVVFPPGSYTTAPKLNQNGIHTYFFQSGVDYWNNAKPAPLDDPHNNLWIIGGQPNLANDTPQIFNSSTPCYSELTAANNPYYYTQNKTPTSANPSTGYGVEWIIGGNTWFDVHTVHLELFTRLGGVTSTSGGPDEGAQGISLREVPPATASGTCASPVIAPCIKTGSGWTPSVPGGTPGQIFQVDQNDHVPEVFLHGGIYVPHNNVELYTNTPAGASLVYTGPIDANSIELASQQASQGNVIIGAGGAAPTTFQLTIVATGSNSTGGPAESSFTEQAVIKETSGTWKVLSWRVCSKPPGNSGAGTAAFCNGTQG